MRNIDPTKEYPLQEVIDLQLIPGIKGYAKLYNLVTTKKTEEGKTVRSLVRKTTKQTIKPLNTKMAWNKISCKIKIKGEEIIKFLQIHNLCQ